MGRFIYLKRRFAVRKIIDPVPQRDKAQTFGCKIPSGAISQTGL